MPTPHPCRTSRRRSWNRSISKSPMPRFRLILAYDGRPFAGWQSQPSGQTVQDTLERAILKILPEHAVRVMASGRTDAGVHALGQVVHFDVPTGTTLPADAWQRALNVHLTCGAHHAKRCRAGYFSCAFRCVRQSLSLSGMDRSGASTIGGRARFPPSPAIGYRAAGRSLRRPRRDA